MYHSMYHFPLEGTVECGFKGCIKLTQSELASGSSPPNLVLSLPVVQLRGEPGLEEPDEPGLK